MTMTSPPPAMSVQPPPSRLANPFATCWTRPGALPFRFPAGQSAERLIAKLSANDWRGAIVGPHGCGKSTLVEALTPALLAAGRHVRHLALRDRQRRLPPEFLADHGDAWILVVDGYEQLGWLARRRLTRYCRRHRAGLLVTAHREAGLPLLVRLAPDRPLVESLVADLAARVSTPITAADIAACHACHGSNVREIFFSLYDRHEWLQRECGRRSAQRG